MYFSISKVKSSFRIFSAEKESISIYYNTDLLNRDWKHENYIDSFVL